MSTKPTMCCSATPPSTQERIRAMHAHGDLFQKVSKYPQAQIHNTFVERWARAMTYMESEVYETARAVDRFVQDNLNTEESEETRTTYKRLMREHIDSLLLFADQLEARVVKDFKTMSSAPVPSKVFMKMFRRYNRSSKYGLRAANGEMANIYGQDSAPIPPELATANDDDELQPGAWFIRNWLTDPVLDYLVRPSKRVWDALPIHESKPPQENQDFEDVYNSTLNTIANMLVYVLATLILIAPIATFNSVEQQAPRIAIMPFFCLLLAASAQLMGPSTAHLFTIVIGYFQTMVVFVSNR